MDRCFTTPNGWTQTSVFAHWLREFLIPQLNDLREPDETALLIFDGHSSHDSDEADKLTGENNIQLIRLPSHTTHKLQPLDVGLFGPMQAAWRKQCKDYTIRTLDEMPLAQLVREYLEARTRVMKESNITSAWKKSGIRSLDPDSFGPGDYGPAQLTSTNTFLPPSYPQTASTNIDLDLGSDTASDTSGDTPWTPTPHSGDETDSDSDSDSTDPSGPESSPHRHELTEPAIDRPRFSNPSSFTQSTAGPSHFPGLCNDPAQPSMSHRPPTAKGLGQSRNHSSHLSTVESASADETNTSLNVLTE